MRGTTTHHVIVLMFAVVLGVQGFGGEFMKFQGLATKQELIQAGDDYGYMKNCGDEKHNFTFKWTPSKIHLGKTVTFTLDFTPVNTFDDINADITVWLKDYPDQPIYTGKQSLSCEKVQKKIPTIKISCPFKEGTRFYVPGFKYVIPAQLPLPTADFKVKLNAKDEKQRDIICATGVLSLVNDQMTNY